MFQKELIPVSFYPGDEWTYLRLYFGPEAADRWIRQQLPLIIKDLRRVDPGCSFFYVRYTDPDFHLRLRIRSLHPDRLAESIRIIRSFSEELIQTGYLWKIELGTYIREVNRFGRENLALFEDAFCADTEFWVSALQSLSFFDDFETLRWKAALGSSIRLMNDLGLDHSQKMHLVEAVVSSLAREIDPPKGFSYRLDQKYRNLTDDLSAVYDGSHELYTTVNTALDNRSRIITRIFKQKPTDERIADLIHMSLNRALRSKHRLQEYILYYYLKKLLLRDQALR